MAETPIFQTTFGNGTALVSSVAPAQFNFSTIYRQSFVPTTADRIFFFTNMVDRSAWHVGAVDNTPDDTNGYMMIVSAGTSLEEFYRRVVGELCLGQRYEFSAYVANLVPPKNLRRPMIRFEIRGTSNLNETIARFDTGAIPEKTTLTWVKYGISFVTPDHSVVLSMISMATAGAGNDMAVDDITLRACISTTPSSCP